MMQMTTISSIRVKPEPARRKRETGWRASDLTVAACKRRLPQIPHGEEHPESEYQHQSAEEHDENGLDPRGEILQVVFDFPLVHLGHLAQEVVQLSRLLAYRDH